MPPSSYISAFRVGASGQMQNGENGNQEASKMQQPSDEELDALAKAEDRKEQEQLSAMREWHKSPEYQQMLEKAKEPEQLKPGK